MHTFLYLDGCNANGQQKNLTYYCIQLHQWAKTYKDNINAKKILANLQFELKQSLQYYEFNHNNHDFKLEMQIQFVYPIC